MSFFALFKGESGTGKTTAALSFPNPIVLDFDRKMPAIAIKHFPDRDIAFKTFESVLHAGDYLAQWKQQGYDTIIVDSITSLSYSCLRTMDVLKGQDILTRLRNLKPSDKAPEMRGFDYYNAEDDFLKFFIDALKSLWTKGQVQNVIVIAHVLVSEQTNIATKIVTKTRRIVTAGSKIAAYIPAQFDECYHFGTMPGDLLVKSDTDAVRVRHVVSTEAIGDDFAKTAYRLPAMIDFTNSSFYEKIRDDIESVQRPGPRALPAPQTEETKAARPKLNF